MTSAALVSDVSGPELYSGALGNKHGDREIKLARDTGQLVWLGQLHSFLHNLVLQSQVEFGSMATAPSRGLI